MKAQTTHHDPYVLIQRLLEQDARYTFSEAQKIAADILKGTVDTGHRLHHPFFYEIRPLIKIAEHLQDEVVGIRFCSQHEEFDGEIHFNADDAKKVEFTRELNKETGANEARRMRLLKQEGHAPAFGKIRANYEKTGAGRKKEIFEENLSKARQIKCDPWHQEISDFLTGAYQAKQDTKYEDYWLCITFNDWELPRPDEKHHFNIPCNQFWKKVAEINPIFERVFIIGDSGNFIWDSWDAKNRCAVI